MNTIQSICVFCGANAGTHPRYLEAAVEVGAELGRRGFTLVYGGGSVGIMGTVARAAREHGCQVVGIIPESLTTRELMGQKIGELIVVETMHQRKQMMVEMSDGFLTLPGGFGTLDELFEVVTWGQLGLHSKPVGLLNVGGYFDGLLQFVDHSVAEGFVRPHHRGLVLADATPAGLLDQMIAYNPPPSLVKWLPLDKA